MDSFNHRLLGRLLSLLSHDARNPLAAALSNASYLRGVVSDPEHDEALADIESSLRELALSLEQLTTIANGLAEETDTLVRDGDVRAVVQEWAKRRGHPAAFVLPAGPLVAKGAFVVERLLDVCLANAVTYANGASLRVAARKLDAVVEVVVCDDGPAIASELRGTLFDADAQFALRTRSDGRYAKALGWFALGELVRTAGGTIEAGEDGGRFCVTVRLSSADSEGAQGAL